MKTVYCRNCNIETPHDLFCKSCDCILPIDPELNLFEILNLKQDLELDPGVLKKNIIELISLYHPDKFSHKKGVRLEIATSNTAIVNNAFQILSQVSSRAEYILSLQKINLDYYSASSLPQSLLLFFLELQEESDLMNTIEELESLKQRCRSQLETNYKDLIKSFHDNQKDIMIFLVIKRKFLDRLINNINRRIENLHDNA